MVSSVLVKTSEICGFLMVCKLNLTIDCYNGSADTEDCSGTFGSDEAENVAADIK